MVVRDFSDAKKQELLELVYTAEIQSGTWYDKLIDFFQDVKIGDNLWWYARDIQTYHAEILDIKNTARADIESIWADVEAVEARHTANMQRLKEAVSQLAAEYAHLAEIINPHQSGGALLMKSTEALTQFFHDNFDVEEAYDLYLQKAVFALMDKPEFSQKAWGACKSAEERQALLNSFFTQVQEIMGMTVERPDILFTHFDDGALGYFRKEYEDVEGERYGRRSVQIESDKVTAGNRQILMSAVIHETRHAFQREAMEDYAVRDYIAQFRKTRGDVVVTLDFPGDTSYPPGDPGPLRHPHTSDATAKAWLEDAGDGMPPSDSSQDSADYLSRPREFDAHSFAGQLQGTPAWYPEETLRRINPSYPGHWELPYAS